MDNLVNIYKSMEIASGANIFISPSVPPKKLSGNQLLEIKVRLLLYCVIGALGITDSILFPLDILLLTNNISY